jgi:hypothetical protein
MVDEKRDFIVKAALETMDDIQYEDREILRARLKGAISSLNKINSQSMVNSLLANFRSQISAVNKEDFEFALNFNRDLIYGALQLKS